MNEEGTEPGGASEEPTVVEVRATEPEPAAALGEPSETTAGSGTGQYTLSSSTRFTKSSATLPSPLILRGEEHGRTRALLKLVSLAGAAALVAIHLPERDVPGRTISTVTTSLVVAVSLWLLWDMREQQRFDARKVLFQGLCCVAAILSVSYYVGIFTPTVLAAAVGIYFFGLGDSTRDGWVIYGSAAGGYFGLNLLAITGVVSPSSSLLVLHDPDPVTLWCVALVTQVVLGMTFWMARRSRAATLGAFERLERAMRQIKKRDALLDEARADLDRARGAGLGRFTDQQVGDYAIGEVIGRGAMGEVYRAIHVSTNAPVALKFLQAGMVEDPGHHERFLREAQIAGRLDSPHVVRLLGTGEVDAAPYIVMELLEGRDLASLLRDKQRLGMSATVELVTQVARALAAADDAGIVHRDLKPQNLYLVETGGRRTWKVLDFGVSKLAEGAANLTLGAAVGTPSYMSPEQARGEPVDHRADVFVLGVIAYRSITGKPAFTASDSITTLYNVVHVQPIRPGELVRVGRDVERVLALALAKQRDFRFGSALLFASALHDAARDRLDDRLRRDADALVSAHPWGEDSAVRATA